jgi:hypothetical protein
MSAVLIVRAKLRDYFPAADGRGNPRQWFALQQAPEGRPVDVIAGPFSTQRELLAQVEVWRESK